MKYNSLEEYRLHRNQKHKEWLNKQPEEQKNKYTFKSWIAKQSDEVKEVYKNKIKTKLSAHCEVCDKQCSNIYSHNKSKKHILLSNIIANENKTENNKTDVQEVPELQ